jgi:hypothetical protein
VNLGSARRWRAGFGGPPKQSLRVMISSREKQPLSSSRTLALPVNLAPPSSEQEQEHEHEKD